MTAVDINHYDYGDVVRVTATFTDPNAADAVVDPGTVSVSYKAPNAAVVTKVYGTDAEVVKVSTGVYRMDIDVATVGTWYYRWFSTGIGKAAEEKSFIVDVAQAL